MRKIIGLVTTFLTLQSCESACIESYLAIVNNSGKDVEIFSYHKFNSTDTPVLSKKIIIANDSKSDNTFKGCGTDAFKFSFKALVEGDSLLIDYGDKVKGYSVRTPNDGRNPYFLDGQNKSNDFIYTITPEDYANATPK